MAKDILELMLNEEFDDFKKNNETKTDLEKLQTFSWILSTLYNPFWIIEGKNGIKATNFSADLVFIKRIFYYKYTPKDKRYFNYHIVGLDYIEKNTKFIIKSQFPIKTYKNLTNKFDLKENVVFKRKNN